MSGRRLQVQGNLERDYKDVLTPEAVTALEALAGLDADRKAVMAGRIARRAQRARDKQRITYLDPDAYIPRTRIKVQEARDGAFEGSEIPADLRRQWIQGTGPAAKPNASVEAGIRNVAHALLSGADGWMFDGEDALGQVSTMSLDNQRNLTLAIRRDRVFLSAAEQVAGEMNRWAREFFGRDDHSGLAHAARLHDQAVPAPRPAPRRPPHPSRRRLRLLGVHRRHHALRRQQPPAAGSGERFAGALSAEDSDGRGSGALERHPLGARGARGAGRRRHQSLRARRAARSVLPADGNPRGARQAFHRVQHRALGLHQQRRRRDGVGSGVRQRQHRRDHDDVRLHAELRGPRAARREHARRARPVRAVAGRDGAEHPRRLRSGCRGQHEARRRRRRARTARGRERQVGRALEDGPHRQAGVGEGRSGQPARPVIPAADVHAGRRGRPDDARAGAAHGSRRAGPAERGAFSTATRSDRAFRRRRSSRRTSSATTTCCT